MRDNFKNNNNSEFKFVKTTKETRESVRYILNRDNYRFYGTETGFMVRCACNTVKEILSDARCERQRNGSQIPVYSKETLANPRKLNRLMYLNGQRCYTPLLERGAEVLKNDESYVVTEYNGRNEYDEAVYTAVGNNGEVITCPDYELQPVIQWLQ